MFFLFKMEKNSNNCKLKVDLEMEQLNKNIIKMSQSNDVNVQPAKPAMITQPFFTFHKKKN